MDCTYRVLKKTVNMDNGPKTGLLGTPVLLEATEQVSDIGLNDKGDLVLEANRLPVSEVTGIKRDSDSPPPSFDNNRPGVLSRVSLAMPPDKVRQALQDLLRAGFETRLGGLFLVIPFLLQTRLERFASMLWPLKQKGIQPVQVLLLMIFSTLAGLKRLSKLSSYQDIGLAVLAGLPKLPTPASIHQFLDQVKPGPLNKTKLSLSRALRRIGIIPGRIINIDMHVTEYFGKERLPEGHHGTKNKPVRCWCTLLAQDQETANPIYHEVFLSHLNPIELLPGFVKKLKEIIGQVAYFTVVFDRGFFKGAMFQELQSLQRVRFVTLAKGYKKIIEQLEAIPASHFKDLCSGKAVVDTFLHITDYQGPLRTIVIKLLDTGKLIGILTNDPKTPDVELILRYARRWRIENLFKDTNSFLHLNRLPGISQSKIDAFLTVKFLAYSLFNLLRNQLGSRFRSMAPESMFENLFNRKAHIQLIGDRLVVTFDYFQGQETVIERFRNFDQKLACFNIDPKVSWFGGAKMQYVFKDKNSNAMTS